MNKSLAVVFAIAGMSSWLWPGFNGYFFDPSSMSAGEGRITGAIFFVGAGIVWFMRSDKEKENR